ncbi:MAG: hypothetical protein COW84_04070 [Gammaproteobacteria bacterium CG22_combo_CG10-13_8_21_14_all_40_8]|nr:MAG: hypothetical protein COW84_04070 [Gammaproteobacteria bacterium CG22_combo_CG10-13_8_21_14_all_40_8]
MTEFQYQWLDTELETGIKLSGNLSKDTSDILWQQRYEILKRCQYPQAAPFVFNLQDLTQIDSAGLATILALSRFMGENTQNLLSKFTLTHPPHQLVKLADANNVMSMLNLLHLKSEDKVKNT